ncbi:unnamed protein product [Candidula unifasciata]|uniref:BTB domain-containing protein n=1 Tax=Candidula unifasciata TaxID=100452 RepID=A0A8S3YV65_9EUPU|nr:unnamed protein product [Candidula unifasciata]
MIFADRPTVRSNTTPTRDESQTGLVSEMADLVIETPSETKSTIETHKPRLHWQVGPSKKIPKSDNFTQKVHVWDETMSGVANKESIRHCMLSQNTPVRNIKNITEKDERVLLNVGGVRHETHVSTLKNVPGSRLARLADLHRISNRGKHEYFFDRHPAVFNSVIDFYRTGELHVPLEVCGAVVKRELDFWQIEELQIKACCWRHYRSYIENERILNSFDRSLEREQIKIDLGNLQGWKLMQMKLWLIMDRPRTSKYAMMYGVTSFLFVTASIAGFCLETLPELRTKITQNTTFMASCNGDSSKLHVVLASNKALSVLDFICTVFFSLELVMRFLVSPWKIKFIRSPMNIIDLLALVPLYVQVIFEQSDLHSCYMNERFVIEIMFILRIFRMFRIFHLVKHYQALKVLVYALRASLKELMMLFIFLLIATLIFATVIYYAERTASEESITHFNTIPIGFWWAITTMTTVGYGDITPKTPVGYIVGTACAVCGVLLVALTFPVISNNFTLFYEHVRSRSLSPRVKKIGVEEIVNGYNDSMFPLDGLSDYGSVSQSTHNLHSTDEACKSRVNTAMNGMTKNYTQDEDITSHKSYVPLAKFCDTSSMMDIIFQEPTDDL